MIDPCFLDVLRKLYMRLSATNVNWAVTGSLCFALQGVPVDEVHDIDLQSDESGVYEIERLFADKVIRKVTLSAANNIRSHFGALLIDGVKVELMGDVEKRPEAISHLPVASGWPARRDDADWEAPVDLNRVKRHVLVDEMRVPVLDLEYEYQAYLKMGRTAKAQMLREWLDHLSGQAGGG
jgi:hypothetical protein